MISMDTPLRKGARITGAEREALISQVVSGYGSGQSIRALAGETGRSYGAVHRILTESGVTFRRRGGATRGRVTAGP